MGVAWMSPISRRNLPHWEEAGRAYFITFRTAAGIVLCGEAKDIVLASVKFHAGTRYALYGCVVMNTHVHCVLQPLERDVARASPPVSGSFYTLAQIAHSVKSYSAHSINRALKRKGAVWLDENYDRAIRNEREFLTEMAYIVNNPAEAGLVGKGEHYKWLYVPGL